jgi:AcrR family transcriptional regulator
LPFSSLASRLGYVYSDNMMINANSVNIKIGRKAYHHGDLRPAVIEAGLELLGSGDVETLSLREVARRVGVSATAIYRHFPDKQSLLAALANHGFAQLAKEQAAAGRAGGPEGFAGNGRAYVRFALANPSLFRLMFAHTPANAHPDLESPEGSAAHLLRMGVASMMPERTSPTAQFAAMLRAWSLVHGLAMLILDNQVSRDIAESMIDEIVAADSLNIG